MVINVHSNYPEFKNLGKYLKEKYNIKMTGLIKFMIENPEVLEELNKKIPEEDLNYRFQKK